MAPVSGAIFRLQQAADFYQHLRQISPNANPPQ